MTTKPALQEILMQTLWERKTKSNKDYNRTEKISRINANFTMALNSYISIIILNVNGLHAPIKRHRVSEWIRKKKDPSICAYNRFILDLKTPAN